MLFYEAVLAPLGLRRLVTGAVEADGVPLGGFGVEHPVFWIAGERAVRGLMHVAFGAESRAVVDAFYTAGLVAGGQDNGAPGLRPAYHAGYYAAFLRDPDGHNIEAVCHRAPV